MASRGDLRIAAQLRPRLAAEYVALEAEIGHTLSPSRRPLREIVGGPAEARDASASGPGAVDARPPPPYKRGTGG